MKVACRERPSNYHFLNHSGLLNFLLKEEKGMRNIFCSRPLVSSSRRGCKVHLCHSPSSLWKWRIFFSLLLGCWKASLFCSSSPDFFLPFLLLPCDVTSQNHNIVSSNHCGENLSDPWVFVHIDVFAVLQGSTCYHHKAFASTQFPS